MGDWGDGEKMHTCHDGDFAGETACLGYRGHGNVRLNDGMEIFGDDAG